MKEDINMKSTEYWKDIQAQEMMEEEIRWESKCEYERNLNTKSNYDALTEWLEGLEKAQKYCHR